MSLSLSEKALEVKPSSTLAITARAKELRSQGVDVIGFGAGEPDFNTPDNIGFAAIAAIQEGFTKYTPASGIDPLKRAICKKFKKFNHLHYETDQIVISNGGKHSLTNIFTALLNSGDEVIIPAPYWLSYPEIVKLSSGVPVFIRGERENNYKVTAEQIAEACNDKTKALVLNSPNNPTGAVYSEAELRAIAKVVVEKDIYVVADEMYENLIYGNTQHISIASFNEEIYKRTITCSGVSKSYAMTGWRIGYTGSCPKIAKLMGNIQSHQTSNPNSIAQKASIEALQGPQETIEAMKREFGKRRDFMYATVSKMPYLKASLPEGAFYLFIDITEVLSKYYNGELVGTCEKMASILINDYNVAIVPCSDFGFADHIRLSYAISIEQIEKGLSRIQNFLESL